MGMIINKITGFIFEGLDTIGYWACLVVAIGGHFAYICGLKQGGKWSTLSTVIYTVIAAINGAVK